MSTGADPVAYIDAAAAAVGLAIPEDCRAGVVQYFGIAAGMAALVMAVPLTAEDEPGALFVPVPVPEAGA